MNAVRTERGMCRDSIYAVRYVGSSFIFMKHCPLNSQYMVTSNFSKLLVFFMGFVYS